MTIKNINNSKPDVATKMDQTSIRMESLFFLEIFKTKFALGLELLQVQKFTVLISD